MHRVVHLNHQNRGMDRQSRKKYKKHLLSYFQKTKTMQTSRSVFGDRIEQAKKTKLELGLIEFVLCFLDGHGEYTNNLVCFNTKSLWTNVFMNSNETGNNQLAVQLI